MKKKLLWCVTVCTLFCLVLCSPVFAASSTIVESETSNNNASNNTMTLAQNISVTGIITTSDYITVNGSFHDGDPVDYYAITPKAGYQGRLAIMLYNVPNLCDYNITLTDSSGTTIYNADDNKFQYPDRYSNSNELVKSNETDGYSKIYLKVEHVRLSNYQGTYNLKIERLIETATVTKPLTPSTLNSTNNAWSADAYFNYSTLPDEAFFISGTVEAKKHATINNTSNNQLRVKFGDADTYSNTITWASGALTIPSNIAGSKVKGPWCASFKATELPVIVAGKSSYIGVVSMNTFKITATYGYDRRKTYPYNLYY